jgi:hypothetical protein
MSGITYDTAWIGARSESLTAPLFIDMLTNPIVPDNPKFQIPENLVIRQDEEKQPVENERAEFGDGTSDNAPGDWTSHL